LGEDTWYGEYTGDTYREVSTKTVMRNNACVDLCGFVNAIGD
jgi:hypothetical protein